MFARPQFWGTTYRMSALLERTIRREASDLKHVVSSALRARLTRSGESRAALAREMGTSRSAVDRMLDEKNTSITLRMLVRAARALGYRLELKMETRIGKLERVKVPSRLKPLMKKLGAALERCPLASGHHRKCQPRPNLSLTNSFPPKFPVELSSPGLSPLSRAGF